MFRAHVLIIRRSKLYYTASGIITPIGGRLVHRLREDCLSAYPYPFVGPKLKTMSSKDKAGMLNHRM